MEISAAIREAIKAIVKSLLFDSSTRCEVVSVDKEANTIVAKSIKDSLEIYEVALIATNGSGIIAYPKTGSNVNVSYLDGLDTMAFVSQYSEIDSYSISLVSGKKFIIDEQGIQLNGNSRGGLADASEIAKRLNALEERMNTHQHLSSAPGSPTAPDLATNPPIEKTVAEKLQNPNVKHG